MLESRNARKIVEVCCAVRRQETVLLVTDPTLLEVADQIAGAVHAVGGEPTIAVMLPRQWDGQEPPTTVAAAMKSANVVIFPTEVDIAHSSAMKEALSEGARALSMAGCGENILQSPAMAADFVRERPKCERLAQFATQAETIHVSSKAGTDITFSVANRSGNSHGCIIEQPGDFSGVPNIEANVSPVEGTAEGVIVFDASIPNLRSGTLREPVRLTVENGVVVKVDGGLEAQHLERMWAEQDDPNVYNIAQFAIGMNPRCHEANGRIVNDHGIYGSAHFGIGTSTNLGGTVKAAGHIDGILYNPTVTFDDTVVLSDSTFRF
jgi:2,5-dihydroxypyridine 5,6-dioxygenase